MIGNPPLAALVLAAGAGVRFGGNKLSAHFRGEPLIVHAVRAARAAPVERVVVVAAAQLDIGVHDNPGPPVTVVRIASAALAETLKAGIAAIGDCAGAFIFLGDMPLIAPDIAPRLAFMLAGHFAALPRHAGKPGHPVLLAAKAFPAIAGLHGDEGAGKLLRSRKDIAFLEYGDDSVLLDVDKPGDIARLEACSAPDTA
jgi:molybdenum cofactor cytidylyltransferase